MKQQLTFVLIAALLLLCGCTAQQNGSSGTLPERPPSSSSSTPPGGTGTAVSPPPGSSSTAPDTAESADDAGDTGDTAPPSSGLFYGGYQPVPLEGLSRDEKSYGHGGPKDALGRPGGAVSFNRAFGAYNALAYVETEEKILYLTFDAGYEHQSLTSSILDTLRQKGVPGTFFLVKHYITSNPDVVQRMVDEGHVLGNHGLTHAALPEVDDEKALREINELHEFVLTEYGYEMTLFRPPAGVYSERSLALTANQGYRSVMWSFAYKDWEVDNQPDTAASLQRLCDNLHPGAIYLLHQVSATNAAILGDFIDFALAQGYTFGVL